MIMKPNPTPTKESVALGQIEALVASLGVTMVDEVLSAVLDPGGSGLMLLDDLDQIAGGVVRAVLGALEPSAAREAIHAGYAAAEAAGDAAEAAKFPRGGA